MSGIGGISEEMLVAWVDGELDEVNRRRVDRAVTDDPALARRAAAHRALGQKLAAHYAPLAQEAVPDRFGRLLADAVTPLPIAVHSRRWTGWAMGGALAASLVLGLGIGRLSGERPGLVTVQDGRMLARGDLGQLLDRGLASAPGDADMRIGLSFRRKGGGWCRSFDGRAASGVACRDGTDWQVQQLLPGRGAAPAYRQASSDDPRLLATIDALIAGDPADGAQEAAAVAAGWN